jgi:thiol-disulfide isomerase/thioredoxin
MAFEIVYIGAKWCATCKVIKPTTLDLGKTFGISVQLKDYDEDLSESDKESITKVPTIRIIKGNDQIQEWNMKQVDSLKAWLTENISLKTDDF